jgi:hypothetical protein
MSSAFPNGYASKPEKLAHVIHPPLADARPVVAHFPGGGSHPHQEMGLCTRFQGRGGPGHHNRWPAKDLLAFDLREARTLHVRKAPEPGQALCYHRAMQPVSERPGPNGCPFDGGAKRVGSAGPLHLHGDATFYMVYKGSEPSSNWLTGPAPWAKYPDIGA